MTKGSNYDTIIAKVRKSYSKRKITLEELQLVKILEDVAAHGLEPIWSDSYRIEHANLGRRGMWRVLVNKSEYVLVARFYPPRMRIETPTSRYY